MPDLMWSIPLNCSDRSLCAIDQVLFSQQKREVAISVRRSLSDGITVAPDGYDEWQDDDRLGTLLASSVNPLAATVFCGSPGSIGVNPSTKNVLFLTEVREHEPWGGLVPYFDEIWATVGRPLEMANLLGRGKRVIPVFPDSKMPIRKLDVPQGDITVFCHEEWEDARGVEALLRAWFRGLEFKDGILLLSMRSCTLEQMSSLVTRIRIEEGCPRGRNKVQLLTGPSPQMLDSCILASDVVVCAHVQERGWRPLAVKAVLCGKPLVSSSRGDIRRYISHCRWVEVPDLDRVTPESLDVATEMMVGSLHEQLLGATSADTEKGVVAQVGATPLSSVMLQAAARLVSSGS